MPSRRTFELIVVTVILMHPALACVRVWAEKHLAVHGQASGGASVVSELF